MATVAIQCVPLLKTISLNAWSSQVTREQCLQAHVRTSYEVLPSLNLTVHTTSLPFFRSLWVHLTRWPQIGFSALNFLRLKHLLLRSGVSSRSTSAAFPIWARLSSSVPPNTPLSKSQSATTARFNQMWALLQLEESPAHYNTVWQSKLEKWRRKNLYSRSTKHRANLPMHNISQACHWRDIAATDL